jgi:MATE family multidrug resistance protein
MLLLPQTIVAIYTDDPSVRVIAAGLLYWAALFQFSDGLQVAAVGALRGFKDTRVAMMITIIAYWLVALPVGYTLALTDFLGPARGARGFWMGLVLGLTLAAVFLLGCLYRVRQAFFVKVRLAKC